MIETFTCDRCKALKSFKLEFNLIAVRTGKPDNTAIDLLFRVCDGCHDIFSQYLKKEFQSASTMRISAKGSCL